MPSLDLPVFDYNDDTRTFTDKLNELARQLEYGINREKSTTAVNFNNRINRNSSVITLPTMATDGSAVDHVINTDGSATISVEWGWAGVNAQIDGWNFYVHQSDINGAYNFGDDPANEQVYRLPNDKRAGILPSAPADKYYTFGIQAYRKVDPDIDPDGTIATAIVKPTIAEESPYQPSANVAFAGDISGTINGLPAADVTGSRIGTAYGINNCTALFHFDQHLKSTQGVSPVGTPVVTLRPGEGKFGGAVAVEEGTTNIVRDASFDSATAIGSGAWIIIGTIGSGDSVTKDTSIKRSGGKSLKVVCASGNTIGAQQALAGWSVGQTVTVSGYVYMPTRSAGRVNIDLYGIGGGLDTSGIMLSAMNTNFVRFSETVTIPAGTTNLYLRAVADGTPNCTFYVDDVQVEVKNFATSAVSAADDVTQATRANGSLQYDKSLLNPTEGTIYGWFKINKLGSYNELLSIGTTTGQRLLMATDSTIGNKLRIWDNNNGVEFNFYSQTSITERQFFSFAYTWGTSGRAIYLNGIEEATNGNTLSRIVSNSYINIGTYNNTFNFLNGLLDELRFDSIQRTAEEIKAWHDSGVPFVDPAQTQLADNTTVTEKGVKVLHSDGSYTEMTWDGFLRYVAGTGKSYHYLLYTNYAQTTGVSPYTSPPADVQVTLPSDFQGKPWDVALSVRSDVDGYGKTTLYAYNKSTATGTFMVKAYTLDSSYRYGGVQFTYFVIA